MIYVFGKSSSLASGQHSSAYLDCRGAEPMNLVRLSKQQEEILMNNLRNGLFLQLKNDGFIDSAELFALCGNSLEKDMDVRYTTTQISFGGENNE